MVFSHDTKFPITLLLCYWGGECIVGITKFISSVPDTQGFPSFFHRNTENMLLRTLLFPLIFLVTTNFILDLSQKAEKQFTTNFMKILVSPQCSQ